MPTGYLDFQRKTNTHSDLSIDLHDIYPVRRQKLLLKTRIRGPAVENITAWGWVEAPGSTESPAPFVTLRGEGEHEYEGGDSGALKDERTRTQTSDGRTRENKYTPGAK